jgi:HPt (histidine-containing phosphotransfer) domain-containing protein
MALDESSSHVERVSLDLDRIDRLRVFSRDELVEIVNEVVGGISTLLDSAADAIEVSDHSTVFQAAHRARNEALVVGARDLIRVLAHLELAAQNGDMAAAGEVLGRVRAAWPASRAAIERLPELVK